MKINIKGLSKEEVILALFDNVYQKSPAAKATWSRMADSLYTGSGLGAPLGMDRAPEIQDITKLISQSNNPLKYVDYIGPVSIKMYFSADEIDTTNYDREHGTSSTPGVMTAAQCIEELRKKKGLLLSASSDRKIEVPSESHEHSRQAQTRALSEDKKGATREGAPSSQQRMALSYKPCVTILGDSTIDNKVWIGTGGILGNRFKEWIGIKRDDTATRIKASQSCCGPELSVVEHLQKSLPSHDVQDYTNDGFTTTDVLRGAWRGKVFPGVLRFSFPEEYFRPLVTAYDSILKSECIILSVGGNNFREFLLNSQRSYDFSSRRWVAHTAEQRQAYIKREFKKVMDNLQAEYIQIFEIIRDLNPTAKIILTTQYYPSAVSTYDYIYPFMKQVGKALDIGSNPNNPMDVIHAIMQETYAGVLAKVKDDSNVVIADVTSSLNPFDKNHHRMQIEPSEEGGKKMARMLSYMVKDAKTTGMVYSFLPEFFRRAGSKPVALTVVQTPIAQWKPKHPYTFNDKACFDPIHAIQLLEKEDVEKSGDEELSGEEYKKIKGDPELQQALIVLKQVSPKLVTRRHFRRIAGNRDLMQALCAAHGYLNSGRFGWFRTHGSHGKEETARFVHQLMNLTPHDLNDHLLPTMQRWLQSSNVHNSSRVFYALKSGFFSKCLDSKSENTEAYVKANPEQRRGMLAKMVS